MRQRLKDRLEISPRRYAQVTAVALGALALVLRSIAGNEVVGALTVNESAKPAAEVVKFAPKAKGPPTAASGDTCSITVPYAVPDIRASEILTMSLTPVRASLAGIGK